MNDVTVQVEHLSKIYQHPGLFGKGVQALQDVTLEAKRGEILAILGLNGAGKSTLIKILLGLVHPTNGSAALFGAPVSTYQWQGRVGYLPELFQAPKDQTAIAFLRFLGAMSGLKGNRLRKRIEECLDIAGLSNLSSQKVKTFSKGMMVRLGIAQAILAEPELLLLDEPTEGLDPLGKIEVRKLLQTLAHLGTTIVMNSHLLSEVEYVAHRVVILHEGTIRLEGKMSELLPSSTRFVVELPLHTQLLTQWRTTISDRTMRCEVDTIQQLQELLAFLEGKGIEPMSVWPERSTLEEVFLNYITNGK